MVLDTTGFDRATDGVNRVVRATRPIRQGTMAVIDVFRLSERPRAPKSTS